MPYLHALGGQQTNKVGWLVAAAIGFLSAPTLLGAFAVAAVVGPAGGIISLSEGKKEDLVASHPVAGLHHGSLLENFPAADKVTTADLDKGWISAAAKGHHLPVIPARVIPRGVALQPRYRKEKDGSLVEFLKPRVTTDESFPRCGDVESPNAATPDAQTAVELPRATDLPRAAAIVAATGAEIGLYAIDFSDAYRYCVIHPADRWTQCVLWVQRLLSHATRRTRSTGDSRLPRHHGARWFLLAIELGSSAPRVHAAH